MNDEFDDVNVIHGTMTGKLKNKHYKVKEVLINDDFHLEVIFHNEYFNFNTNSKYYLVDKENIRF